MRETSFQEETQKVISQTDKEVKGFSIRAVILGCIGIWLFVMTYMRTSVLNMGHPIELDYTPSIAGGALIAFGLLINLILSKTKLKRYLFTQSELLVMYVMVMISSVIVHGLRFFYSVILVPNYVRDVGGPYRAIYNNLNLERISPLLIPQGEEALLGFYTGRTSVPWDAWITPLILWSLFFMAFFLVAICLATLVKKRWTEVDRLTFPLAVPIIQIANVDEKNPLGPLWKNNAVRLGVIFPIIYYGSNILNTYWPVIPAMNLNYNFQYMFESPVGQWIAIAWATFRVTPMSVGILYQVPNDLLGSALIFGVIFIIRLYIMSIFDGPETGPLFFATSAERSMGPAAWGLALLWFCRREIIAKIKAALKLTLSPSDKNELDPDAALPNAFVIFGILIGYIALVAFLKFLVGIPVYLGALYFGIMFLAMIAFARMGAEAGLFYNSGSAGFLEEALGTSGLAPKSAPILGGYFGGTFCSRGVLPVISSMTLHSYKMAEESKMKSRSMTTVIIIALVVSLIILPFFVLPIAYSYGAPVILGTSGNVQGGEWNIRYQKALVTYPALFLVSAIFSVVFVWFLMFMRMRFVWWPLHPYAYIASFWMTRYWWGSILVAWIIKGLVMRWTGGKTRNTIREFFMGVIVGSIIMEAVRMIVGVIFV